MNKIYFLTVPRAWFVQIYTIYLKFEINISNIVMMYYRVDSKDNIYVCLRNEAEAKQNYS